MPMTTETPSRNRRYPWEVWFDGKRRAILADQFDVTIESFRSTARTAARNRGVSVSVTSGTVEGHPVYIIEAFGGHLDELGEGVDEPSSDPVPAPDPAL